MCVCGVLLYYSYHDLYVRAGMMMKGIMPPRRQGMAVLEFQFSFLPANQEVGKHPSRRGVRSYPRYFPTAQSKWLGGKRLIILTFSLLLGIIS